jgi:hypothetical protein
MVAAVAPYDAIVVGGGNDGERVRVLSSTAGSAQALEALEVGAAPERWLDSVAEARTRR